MFLSRKVFAISFCGFYFYKILLSFIIFYYCKGIIRLLGLSECESWYLLAAIFEKKKQQQLKLKDCRQRFCCRFSVRDH